MKSREDEMVEYENKGFDFIADNADEFGTCLIMENVWSIIYIMFGWTTAFISEEPPVKWRKVTAKEIYGYE